MNEFPRSTNYNYWHKSVRICYKHDNVQLQNKVRNCAEKAPNTALKIQELITDHIGRLSVLRWKQFQKHHIELWYYLVAQSSPTNTFVKFFKDYNHSCLHITCYYKIIRISEVITRVDICSKFVKPVVLCKSELMQHRSQALLFLLMCRKIFALDCVLLFT